jgi:hypothetical protein
MHVSQAVHIYTAKVDIAFAFADVTKPRPVPSKAWGCACMWRWLFLFKHLIRIRTSLSGAWTGQEQYHTMKLNGAETYTSFPTSWCEFFGRSTGAWEQKKEIHVMFPDLFPPVMPWNCVVFQTFPLKQVVPVDVEPRQLGYNFCNKGKWDRQIDNIGLRLDFCNTTLRLRFFFFF